jgi:hypothetical protein
MAHTKVMAKVVTDNTGFQQELPVLLVATPNSIQVFEPLLDYLLKYSNVRSLTWMEKLCQIVGLLLDYMEVNKGLFDKPVHLFTEFTKRIHLGTIGTDGLDPSGLYWLPKTAKNANQLLSMLSGFSDDLVVSNRGVPLNPWVEATAFEQMVKWAAWTNKSERSFLGHLDKYSKATDVVNLARQMKLPTTPKGDTAEKKAFPDKRLEDLLFNGFVNPGQEESKNELSKYDWRGICIALLMNGGGLRVCECFHIWIHDIQPDPLNPDIAHVRVYHPAQGAAPKDFILASGKAPTNRAEYLAAKHPNYPPRHKASGSYHAGWKNPKLSNDNERYLHVHWFPSKLGKYFLIAWRMYLTQRISYGITAAKHPFLFASHHGKHLGEPYTMSSFREALERAVERIGMGYSKAEGTTEHGHRHAYGQRATRGELGVSVIQAGMHHVSPESQEVYTTPSIAHVTKKMAQAQTTLEDPFNFELMLAFNNKSGE